MADSVAKVIDFDAPFEKRRGVLEAIARAIAENWPRFADEWSTPPPQIDVDEWMHASAPDKLDWIEFSDEAKAEGAVDFGSVYLTTWFSPLSIYSLTVGVRQYRDGTLSVLLSADENILYEWTGKREEHRMKEQKRKIEQDLPPGHKWADTFTSEEFIAWSDRLAEMQDTESVGPQNKQCLLHVAEAAAAALPVRDMQVDEELDS